MMRGYILNVPMTKIRLFFLSLYTFFFTYSFGVFADGLAKPWQIGFQESASPLATAAIGTHNYIMAFMAVVIVVVLAVLIYACVRFRASKNDSPSTRTHNVLLEIIWIVIPTIIVALIAVPSVKLIYKQETIPQTDMTLKVIGHQWYWSYVYPDFDDISFDSYMKKDDELENGEPRLLAVDNEVVLPVETYIEFQVTSADVIHAFAIPSLGVKIDAVPGRLNNNWAYIEKPGIYYGQCSELCGVYHAFMPIKIRAVTKEEFKKWLIVAQQQFALSDTNNNLTLALNR